MTSVEKFVLAQHAAGRSLRKIAEPTDRSHAAERNILNKYRVRRRGNGAATLVSRAGSDGGSHPPEGREP